MNDRDRILDRLPPALAAEPRAEAGPIAEGDWELMRIRLEALGAELRSLDSLGELRGRTAVWDARLGDLATALGLAKVDVWEAEMGLSLAEVAIAETGSVVLAAGPESARLGSLAPPLNIVVVRRLVATLDDAFTLGMPASSTVVVTGPSRTADIEGILVRGVHGPGALWVVREP